MDSSSDNEDQNDEMDSQDEKLILNNKKKYSSATIAANVAIKNKISSSKAANIQYRSKIRGHLKNFSNLCKIGR